MSLRTRSIDTAIRAVLKAPESRAELALLAARLAYWQTQVFLAALSRQRTRALDGPWVSARKLSRVVGFSPRWLYDHARTLPFARHEGRSVRFNEAEARRWMRQR